MKNTISLLFGALALIVGFQNCGPEGQFESIGSQTLPLQKSASLKEDGSVEINQEGAPVTISAILFGRQNDAISLSQSHQFSYRLDLTRSTIQPHQDSLTITSGDSTASESSTATLSPAELSAIQDALLSHHLVSADSIWQHLKQTLGDDVACIQIYVYPHAALETSTGDLIYLGEGSACAPNWDLWNASLSQRLKIEDLLPNILQ